MSYGYWGIKPENQFVAKICHALAIAAFEQIETEEKRQQYFKRDTNTTKEQETEQLKKCMHAIRNEKNETQAIQFFLVSPFHVDAECEPEEGIPPNRLID